jgi:hypothetical protein
MNQIKKKKRLSDLIIKINLGCVWRGVWVLQFFFNKCSFFNEDGSVIIFTFWNILYKRNRDQCSPFTCCDNLH